MKKVLKVWNVISSIIVIAVVLLAIALAGVRVVGLNVFTVLSGSMEPLYHTGSLIYVKSVDYTELSPGDVITFMASEDTIVTHRIVDVVPDDEEPGVVRYRTKGDANNAEDGTLVHYKNVIGKPVFTIPKLGYLASFIQEPPGFYVAISIGAILLLIVFIPEIFATETKKEEKTAEKNETESEKDETEEGSAKKD